jgi:putative SbcD/Mre11-related phosphoesterase
MFELCPKIKICDLALWLPKQKVLVISDIHIGYEEALNESGIFLPRHQLKDTKERLQKILTCLEQKPNKIIIAGDLKYEFGTVNKEEFFGLKELLKFLKRNCKELIILKGNHDRILNYLRNKKIKIATKIKIGKILLSHGDYIDPLANSNTINTIIIGHVHPAIKLSDGFVAEKVKCFIKGKWKGKTLVALPSLNLVTEGTDILTEKILSPYMSSIKDLEIWAVPEFGEVLYFGKLKQL